MFAATCLVPLLRKVRDDTHERKYVAGEPFEHFLEYYYEKEAENTEDDEHNEEDEKEDGDEKESEKGEGFEWGGKRRRKGEEYVGESDKSMRGKLDGEKAEVHEKEKDRRTEKNEETTNKKLKKGDAEQVESKAKEADEQMADENVGKDDGDEVKAKEQADAEGEHTRVGEKQGIRNNLGEEEEKREGENIGNFHGKRKHKSKIELDMQDDVDSSYKAEKKDKGVEITEKASKNDAEEEEEEEEEKEGKDYMVLKQEEDPQKFPDHLESVFHVNQSNKYPSHDDDRIAYQVFALKHI